MIKILCLIDTLAFGGGAERQISGLAGMLHKNGYNVTLATYHKHNYDNVIYEKYGIRSELIRCGKTFYSKLFAVMHYIKNRNFDVVIAYKDGPTMISCLCKLMGCNFKLIVSERNNTQKISFRERIKFFLYSHADTIVPNSHSQGNFIKDNFSFLSKKIYVITNFVDISLFHPGNRHIISDKIKILVVARINPQKNIERFLNVVRRLKQNGVPVIIDWYGGVYGNTNQYAINMTRYYNELDISDYLSFKGDTLNISEVYREYDVFCLPSLYEGYPNVICEAMSSGLPIVCSKVNDNPLIVEEGINGYLFNPKDEDEMYHTILNIINNNNKFKEMGLKSRELAESKFSEERFIHEYIRLIQL